MLVNAMKERGIAFDDEIRNANFDLPLLDIETDEDEEDGEEDWTKIRLRRVDWSWWSLTQQWVRETLGGSGPFAVDEIHAFESVAVPGECEGFMLGDPVARTFDTKGFNQVMLDRARDIMAYGGPYENVMVGSAPRILRELESSARAIGLPLEMDELIREVEDAFESDTAHERPAEINALLCIYFLRLAIERKHFAWWVKT